VAVEAAAQRFLTLDDLINERALFHDFTNRALVETEPTVPLRSPAEAATILARLTAAHRFTLYEYFMTDRIGHAQDYEGAGVILAQLAEFIRELLARLDLTKTTVLLTSDHGNIEDLSARNHTLNPVPTLLWGRDRERLQARISTLADLTPAILETLLGEHSV
jgi:bisphosphoglycerate-independent phosphoglycerate mutase (AlkP superfamily)